MGAPLIKQQQQPVVGTLSSTTTATAVVNGYSHPVHHRHQQAIVVGRSQPMNGAYLPAALAVGGLVAAVPACPPTGACMPPVRIY